MSAALPDAAYTNKIPDTKPKNRSKLDSMKDSKLSNCSNNTYMSNSLHTVNKFKTNIKNLLRVEKIENKKKLTAKKEK